MNVEVGRELLHANDRPDSHLVSDQLSILIESDESQEAKEAVLVGISWHSFSWMSTVL